MEPESLLHTPLLCYLERHTITLDGSLQIFLSIKDGRKTANSSTSKWELRESWKQQCRCEHHTLEVLISEPSANVCDVTTFPATAVCDSNIDICTNGKDPTELGTKELTKSEDNDLTTVVFHSNEDNSNCTSAFEFCSAHDDDSVTERDDTTLTAIAVCDSRINIWDTSSYTTTKLDETNNDEGSDDSPAFGLSFGEKQLRKQQVNVSKEGVEQTWKVENQIA
ncbi:uncharacterized protein RHO17_014862 [Thomomys bottae]